MRSSSVLDDRAPGIGDAAPDFDLARPDGSRVRLRELRGQPVVVAFFPPEWDPSRDAQVRHYESALRELPAEPHFLRINGDGLWCDVELHGEEPVRFPLVTAFETNREAAKAFGVEGRQAVFVLDGEGIVKWRHVGQVGTHASADDIVRAVESALNGDGAGVDAGVDDEAVRGGVSRRRLLAIAIAASVALLLFPHRTLAEPPQRADDGPPPVDGRRTITLNVNGKAHRVEIDPRVSLLDALRERLGLFGAKKGCDHGQCGACTVHVDGRRVNSCLMLAMQAEGLHVTTIEGLSHEDRLHPMQAAFVKHDGFQCGYCTPGQIMSAVACLREGHAHSDEDIREFMSGNICRCGAYVGICEAIKEVRDGGGQH